MKLASECWEEGIVQAARPDQAWVYRKPDSQWTILKMCQQESGRKFTAKGVVKFEPRHGDRLKMAGTWKKSDFNGEDEFNFHAVSLQIPTDAAGLLEYAVTLTKGLGPVKQQEIWQTFGADWMDHPDLEGIAGIPAATITAWQETLRRIEQYQEKAKVMAFLLGKRCSMVLAEKAWDLWGQDAIPKVQEDPYRLCWLPRVGFLGVENAGIPGAFAIAKDDPRRLRAAVMYAMGGLTEQIGTLVKDRELLEHPAMIGLSSAATDAIGWLVEAGELVRIGEAVARKVDYENEMKIKEWAI